MEIQGTHINIHLETRLKKLYELSDTFPFYMVEGKEIKNDHVEDLVKNGHLASLGDLLRLG